MKAQLLHIETQWLCRAHFANTIAIVFIPILLLAVSARISVAANSTWLSNPGSDDWNTASNWAPPIVPNGPTATATFGVSSITAVSVSSPLLVVGLTFSNGASAYTITVTPEGFTLNIDGNITNNSGITQNVVASGGGTSGGSGSIFFSSGTVGNQTSFTNNGAAALGGGGGGTLFQNASSAGEATLIANGSGFTTASYGIVYFEDTATAANATLIANPGTFSGGAIRFWDDSTGGTARAMVFGNGKLDISPHGDGVSSRVVVGSIEGDGLIYLGSNILEVGSNSLSTQFNGMIRDGGFGDGTGGQLHKIGSGTLTLTKGSTYTGSTTVEGGILLANNIRGSATGSGVVHISAGTLGGSGTISGEVNVGTGIGPGAILGPGAQGTIPGTLVIKKRLTLRGDATYNVLLDSSAVTADKVVVRGVRILGAQIALVDRSSSVLPPGTVFTLIDNPANTVGRFTNLGDGSTITIGTNTFQASYSGGDGNDLILTVVP